MMYQLQKLKTLISNIVKRAYISKLESDSEGSAIAQVSYLGKTGISEIISPYGLDARPPLETQVLLFAVQGHENNRGAIAYSREKRLKDLSPGEVALHNAETKTFIKLDKDGNIIIDSTAKVVINAASDIEIVNQGKLTINSDGDIRRSLPEKHRAENAVKTLRPIYMSLMV